MSTLQGVSARTFSFFFALLAVIGLLAYGLISKGEDALAVGERAPAGELPVLGSTNTGSIADYRGKWVLVNVWASWCDPCRYELPFFQRQAVKRGARVAFLGVNSNDNRAEARRLGARYPMPYPSFVDRRLSVAGEYGARGLPATAFYDASGKRVLVHQGPFTSEDQLAAQIDRYALGRG